ncbi:MAG: LEA type 2 family protein [Gemmatimonadota bacterium]
MFQSLEYSVLTGLSVIVAAAFLAGCAGMTVKPTEKNFQAPTVTLSYVDVAHYFGWWYYTPKVKPTKGTAGHNAAPLDYAFIFDIQNPNPFPVLLDGLKFACVIDGFEINSGYSTEQQWIPAGKTNQVRVVAVSDARAALLSLLVTGAVDRREHRRAEFRTEVHSPADRSGASAASISETDREARKDGKGDGAFSLVFRSRYLLLIALLVLFMNWVNTTGQYILDSVVEDAARGGVAAVTANGQSVGQYIGSFYSDFFAVVNVAGLLLQLFVVSRIVKYLGIRIAILFLPIIALGSYGLIAFLPVLGIVRWAKTAENSTDYSLQNTVRQTLFLPLTRDQKYKAKQAIDAFFWRAGDVLSALLVWVGTTWLALSASGFAKFNMVLVLIWLGLSVAIGREYSRRARGSPAEAVNGEVVEG